MSTKRDTEERRKINSNQRAACTSTSTLSISNNYKSVITPYNTSHDPINPLPTPTPQLNPFMKDYNKRTLDLLDRFAPLGIGLEELIPTSKNNLLHKAGKRRNKMVS